MKLNIKTIIPFFLGIILLTLGSCEDMLETDSNRVAFENDNRIKNPDDAFYIISGILQELRKVGDRYIIMGELRGDLMTISPENASVSLKEIYEFQTTSNNDYSDQRDYYNVINNCNYALQKMDTSLVSRGQKVMVPAYAEIKAMRAWTYWQMAQIFGKVKYLEEPVLSLESSLKEYPDMGMDDLVAKLVADLLPYSGVKINNSQNLNLSPDYSYSIQIPMLLGDLYLYQNNYNHAATMYFIAMSTGNNNDSPYLLNGYVSSWTDKTFMNVTANHPNSYSNEVISAMSFTQEAKDLYSRMINLTYNDKASLLPAENYIKTMRNVTYVDIDKSSKLTYTTGDLRGYVPASTDRAQIGDAYYYVDLLNGAVSQPMIYKFYNAKSTSTGYDPSNNLIKDGLSYLSSISLYRQPHLYLRYAQAVNRAGKPTLAYAVLKYGLTHATVIDSLKVNQSEIAGEAYTNIPNSFDGNIASMSRGLGTGVARDSIYYIIPEYTSTQDSIEWVEDRILEELAAETPFEGNRFFDLLCVSRRRPNHPEYMADKVSAKYADPAAMKARLMNMDNWFIK